MKLGYGNYGMKAINPFDLAARLASLGYGGFEVCVMNGWPTHPDSLDPDGRKRLRGTLEDAGLEFTAALGGFHVLAPDEQFPLEIDAFRGACQLARDLTDQPKAVVTSTLGGSAETDWEAGKKLVGDRCSMLADAALKEGCVFAVEAHVGGLLDRPERVVWLLTEYDHPGLRANFDISHFLAAGYDMAESIEQLVPYAVHAHVKDSTIIDGKVRFLLPGEGTTNYVDYFRLLARAQWGSCVTVEVSQQVFTRTGYEPWEAAEFSFAVLDRARHEALSEVR